jgi:hypothetical protein
MATPRHPDHDDLLRYADGELRGLAARRIRKHLEACWQCRADLQDIENAITGCVDYRKNVLQRLLPPPPAPWSDIYAGFAKMDATEPDFLQEGSRPQRVGHPMLRWAAVAAVVLLASAALVYRFRQTPTVQASELLRKAVAAADSAPPHQRRIRIQTRQRRLTRFVGTPAPIGSTASEADALNSLRAMFVAASYDWQDPLSARAFQGWRDHLSEKQDRVLEQPASYRLRTTTSSGELVAATLTLNRQDLTPVAGRFEFRNQNWVEMTADNEELPPPVALDQHAAPIATEAASGAPPKPSPAPAPEAATASDELQVLAALHQLGADLGEPIEVMRTGTKVVVSGIGIAPQRRQQITEALAQRPRVDVRFSDSAPTAVQPEKESAAQPAATEFENLQARLAKQMGGREFFDQLGAEALDTTESMMSRIYALKRLAERFGASSGAELSGSDLDTLKGLLVEHTSALKQQTIELDQLLQPVLRSLGASAAPANLVSATSWAPATEDLFQSARQVEKLSAVLFGAAPGDSSDGDVPSKLMSSLAGLRARLDAYARLTASPGRSNR